MKLILQVGIPLLATALLVGSLVELAWVADAGRTRTPASTGTLFTDAIEPELPIASEIAPDQPSPTPVLTR